RLGERRGVGCCGLHFHHSLQSTRRGRTSSTKATGPGGSRWGGNATHPVQWLCLTPRRMERHTNRCAQGDRGGGQAVTRRVRCPSRIAAWDSARSVHTELMRRSNTTYSCGLHNSRQNPCYLTNDHSSYKRRMPCPTKEENSVD